MILPNLTVAQASFLSYLEAATCPQTKFELATGPARCCLGVACDWYIEYLGNKGNLEKVGDRYYWNQNGERLSTEVNLPKPVQRLLKTITASGHNVDGNKRSIAYMNDYQHMSFAQIASVLREHPEEYFRQTEN